MIQEYDHNSFILYKDSRIFISRLTKSQRGELLMAIFDYACDKLIPDFEDDPMLDMCFEMIRAYLDRDEKKYKERCEKNRENIRKRWNKSNTNANNRNKSNTNYTDKDTDKDKDTDTDSDNDTVSDTDTEKGTEQNASDLDSVERPAVADAEKTAPPPADLFSFKQVKASAKRNKVNLTEEGLEAFYEEMLIEGWTLYGKPIERRYFARALREWAKRHPEYSLDCEEDPDPEPETEPEDTELSEKEQLRRWISKNADFFNE